MDKAMNLAMEAFRKVHGPEAELDNGDSFVVTFTDGTLILEMDDGELEVNVIYGSPMHVEATID